MLYLKERKKNVKNILFCFLLQFSGLFFSFLAFFSLKYCRVELFISWHIKENLACTNKHFKGFFVTPIIEG